ncbi:MAG: TRAP transporter permease, partial [bacterium]
LIAGGLQGYLYVLGALDGVGASCPGRVLMVIGGLILAAPENPKILGLSHLQINSAALAVAVVGVMLCWLGRRRVEVARRTAG